MQHRINLEIYLVLLMLLMAGMGDARINEEKSNSDPIVFKSSQNGEEITLNDVENFKRTFSLKSETDIPLQALGPSNRLVYNENVYVVDEINTPSEIFASDATYMHNGIPAKHPTSNIYREENDQEIITVVRNSNHELMGLTIQNKINKGTTEINRISSGVFATIEDINVDYDEINRKYSYGEQADESNGEIYNFTHENKHRKLATCSSFKILELAVAYESSFCRSYGNAAGADAKVISLVADVSTKFQQSGLCIKVVLSHLEGYCDSSIDPYKQFVDVGLSGCSSYGLLNDVRNYWSVNRGYVKRDAMNLFSGTSLECGFSGCTIGCAFSKTICLGRAHGVNHITFSSSRFLQTALVAHELGHICGATHESQKNYIMTASINLAPLGFSSGSITSMRHRIDSTQCVENEIEPTQTPTFLPSASPTHFPTSQPTPLSSSSPTLSSLPSTIPSLSPTLSLQPSTSPSSLPTIMSLSTRAPHASSLKSHEPSKISRYTSTPSTLPSLKPTPNLTTSQPTQTFSYMPSLSPSEPNISFNTIEINISFQLQEMGIPQTIENVDRMKSVMESSLRNIFNDEETEINLVSFEQQTINSKLVDVAIAITQNGTCINSCSDIITKTVSIITDSIKDGSLIAETKEVAVDFLIEHLYKNVRIDLETLTVIDPLISENVPIPTMKTIVINISFQLQEMGTPQTIENVDRMKSVMEPSLINIFNDEENEISLVSFEQQTINSKLVDVAVAITQNEVCLYTCSDIITKTVSIITDSIKDGSLIAELKLVSAEFLVVHLYKNVRIDLETLTVIDPLISNYVSVSPTPINIDNDPIPSCLGSVQQRFQRIISLL